MKTKKICQSCKETNKTVAELTIKADEYFLVKDHLKKDIKLRKQNVPPLTSVKMGKKYANRYIFYYAAKEGTLDNCVVIPKFKDAYSNLENSGVGKLDKNGEAQLHLKCPRGYHKMGKTYISHVHFIVSNKSNNKWENKIYSKRVICDLDKKQLKSIINSDCALILNALPMQEYIKNRIPKSIPLPYNLELKDKEIINYIKDMVVHSPKIVQALKNKKIKLLDIPIVTYCYSPECSASNQLVEKLINVGFTNITEYSGGITDWLKKI